MSFLSDNYGPNGLLVFIVPSEQIDVNYFKTISANLNRTFKFTFGNVIDRILSDEFENSNLNNYFNNPLNEPDIKKLRVQFDDFFGQINQRLFISSLFNLYNTIHNKTFNVNLINNQQQQQHLSKLSNLDRFNFLIEMRDKFINSIPYLDLPYNIKCDLDSAMIDVEAQEFIDLENNYYKNRRQFNIIGSCLFYKVRISVLYGPHF